MKKTVVIVPVGKTGYTAEKLKAYGNAADLIAHLYN